MHLKRRNFITLLGGAAAWPLAARAQQGVRRIGVLMNAPATDAESQSYMAAFVHGLRQLGYVEGQNLRIDIRWSAGDATLARTYAAQLIGLMPDVILAVTSINLEIVRQATNTIPVIFAQVSDPVTQGFVHRFRRDRVLRRWQMARSAQGDCARARACSGYVQPRHRPAG
jgi:ABC-type uncharacterized transport system substrate-binding protein